MAYVTQSMYPSGTPTASIFMDGLLALCFKGKDKCTVGVNVQPKHEVVFGVWQTSDPANPCKEFTKFNPSGKNTIRIRVKKTKPAVEVYDGGPMFLRQRFNFVNRCVDLEAIHGKPIKNLPGTLWPRVEFDDGVLCGYRLSTGPFDFVDSGGAVLKDLEQLSLGIVCDIFLEKSADFIEVTFGTTTLRLSFGERYEIGITNVCDPNAVRLDFEDHYKVLDVSGLPSSTYNLHNRLGIGEIARTQLGGCVAKIGHPFSDRTPCMAATFGETEEFEP